MSRITATTVSIGLILAGLCCVVKAHAYPPRGSAEDLLAVEAAIRDCIGWALTKDRGRLESILAHDEDLFIFHPNWGETIVGWAEFLPLFDVWMDPRFKATHFEIRDLRICFSGSRDVAWFATILDDHGEWDGKPAAWRDTRWTGVLERRKGSWLLVQMHFSFAADKVLAGAGRLEQEETHPTDP